MSYQPFPAAPAASSATVAAGPGASDRVAAVASLRPDWHISPESYVHVDVESYPTVSAAATDYADTEALGAIGMFGLGGLTAEGGTAQLAQYDPTGGVYPAGLWSGWAALGPHLSAYSDADPWPTTGLTFTFRGAFLPHMPMAGEWNEIVLATIDETDDYFEPGFVTDNDGGVYWGFDYLVTGYPTATERTIIVPTPLPDPHGDHTYVWTVNQSGWSLTIDGELHEADDWFYDDGNFAVQNPWDSFTFLAPPDGTTLWAHRLSIAGRRTTLVDQDGNVCLDLNAADGRNGGAFTTGAHTWTPNGGRVQRCATDTPRVFGPHPSLNHGVSDNALLDIGAGDSFTWAIRFLPGTAVDVGGGLLFNASWGRNVEGLFGGEPCWEVGITAPPLGVGYGIVLSDGTPNPVQALPAVPDYEHTMVVVLDRDDGEVSIYVDGDHKVTADVSGLGAIANAGMGNTAMQVGIGWTNVAWAAMWRRALTPQEVALIP